MAWCTGCVVPPRGPRADFPARLHRARRRRRRRGGPAAAWGYRGREDRTRRPVMTSARPFVAAFEGPCCAGKTTLAHLLSRRLNGLAAVVVECYADHVGGGRFLPRQEAN